MDVILAFFVYAFSVFGTARKIYSLVEWYCSKFVFLLFMQRYL